MRQRESDLACSADDPHLRPSPLLNKTAQATRATNKQLVPVTLTGRIMVGRSLVGLDTIVSGHQLGQGIAWNGQSRLACVA